MSRPIVAVVGRPNVGKSTLFNMIAGKDLSIVEDTPGVTRDRIYADTEWVGHAFTLIDTGGIEPDSDDIILSQMREQAELAIESADVIIFLTDVQEGLVDADREVADMLRRSGKPVVLAVNKADQYARWVNDSYEFYELGIGDPFLISARGKIGLGDLLDEVVRHLDCRAEEEEDERPRIAIIGKPNAGKSSIVNRLIGENRVLVSDIPGTTRDAVDTTVKANGKEYVLTDTAGLRRKSRRKETLEYYSVVRAVLAVERSDIAILVIDAAEGISEQDAKIAGIAHERGKGIIIAVNKWDAVEKDNSTVKQYEKDVRNILSFIPYAPIIFVSAKTGQRLMKLYPLIDRVLDSVSMRVPTGVLNEVTAEAVALNQPPTDKGKRLKLFYATQIGVKPPTFVLFVNDKKLMHFSYQRYLENKIRESFGFEGTSLRFILRERKAESE